MTTVPQPQIGDFGLCIGRDFIGRMTDLGEFLYGDEEKPFRYPKYTHAFVVVRGGFRIEAWPGGARRRPLSDLSPNTVTYSSWILSTDTRLEIANAAESRIGTPYSWLDYGALTTHRLHIPVPGLRGYIESSHHMICSQYVDWCYLRAGRHMFKDGRWPGYVTPEDLSYVLTGPQM